MQAAGPDPSPEAVLRSAMVGAQPIDDESRTYILLFFAFYIAALTDPSLSSAIDVFEGQRWIVTFMAEQIRYAQQEGETRDGIDANKEAALLLATNTGLGLGVLSGLFSPDERDRRHRLPPEPDLSRGGEGATQALENYRLRPCQAAANSSG